MPILGYWDIRGLGEPIRYLLHYKGIKFEDKRYESNTVKLEDKCHTNVSQLSDIWQKDKFQLNLDFPNLPYYIDGKIRLTQSIAILRYLARKYDLVAHTEEERVRVDMVEQQIMDFQNNLARVCYDPNFENIKEHFISSVPAQLKPFSAFLGDRKYLAGDNLTYVDFLAYETFDFYRLLIPTVLHDFPNLKKYEDGIENLPELQEYLQSSTYKRWPIFSALAYFGGDGPEPKRV